SNISATAAVSFTGVVATFNDADPNANAKDYTAVINWGDGHTTNGAIAANGQGGFNVTGTNTYAQPGKFAVSVDVADFGGSVVSVANTATVKANPALAGTGSIIAVGADAGGVPQVRVFDAQGVFKFSFFAYDKG